MLHTVRGKVLQRRFAATEVKLTGFLHCTDYWLLLLIRHIVSFKFINIRSSIPLQ